MTQITIYTDGSCQTQTCIGGWAAILTSGTHRRVISGSVTETTVNAMELKAVIEALRSLKQPGCTVTIKTDSAYVVQGMNEWRQDWIARSWRTASGNPVANRELWQELVAIADQHTVTFTWVPREQNTEADRLAQSACAKQHRPPTAAPVAVTHLMIAGSREATPQMLDYARRAVRRAHDCGYTVIVGDNPKGVDMAVVSECRRLKAAVIVAGIQPVPRNGGCDHGGYVCVERDIYRGMGGALLNGYTVHDRWMVDSAQLGVFIWNGDSPGTKAGYDYMVTRGKDAHLINFGMEV